MSLSPMINPFHWNIFCFFCSDVIDITENYFNIDLLKVLLKEASSDVFNFPKEINKFYKL